MRCLFGVGFLLNNLAALQQDFERFGIVEEQAVINHVLIVCGQFDQRTIIRDESEPTSDSCVVVDGIAVRVLFCKE